MRNILSITCYLTLVCSCSTERENSISESISSEYASLYDSLLANELGADDYGMRKYVIADLIAGPNRDQDSITAAQIQRAHVDNIMRMAEEGKLVLAGPYLDESDIKGIYVFAVETVAEAEALTNTDPAVRAGRLKMKLRPWYGSAALMKVNEIGLKLSKKSI